MTSATARLRQAKNAKKKAAAILGTSGSIPLGTPSGQVSPAPSLEIVREKRGLDGDLEDVSSRKNPRLDAAGGSAAGLHRLTPGHSAEDFVLPPAFGHSPLFEGHTKGRNSQVSEAVFRLLEVVTFLNGRECHYLKERDVAAKRVTELGKQLREMTVAFDDYKNKYALQLNLVKDLEEAEVRLAEVVREKDALVEQVKGLKERIAALKEKIKSAEVALISPEEQKLDPAGDYAEASRADLNKKILDFEASMIAVASAQFQNAVAQLRILNPNIEFVEDGLDEDKDVREGRIATPRDDDLSPDNH
ncbi:hypothetical protein A2U01_0008995 [Trifolium medium]|uniref:Uncharacterized protein n=1 Tax=Trifolium medium TaxID=97028 RepID=A0A392MPB9_9FABA|nr:hypothetical protein [Trifolium medium]